MSQQPLIVEDRVGYLCYRLLAMVMRLMSNSWTGIHSFLLSSSLFRLLPEEEENEIAEASNEVSEKQKELEDAGYFRTDQIKKDN